MTVPADRRIIFYYQTLFQNGDLVSLEPIITLGNPSGRNPYTTVVQLSSFHFGFDANNQPYIHLNDDPPTDPMFVPVWQGLAAAQAAGISATMMLGGAGGAYTELFANYDTFYPILVSTLKQFNLNGIDLDIEEQVTLANTEMLIQDLNRDFGSGFLITMAPVASELSGGGGLSGLNYNQLYDDVGSLISWFNGQFYNGWGSPTVADYTACVNQGFPPSKIVLGTPGNPADGNGYVSLPVLSAVVNDLSQEYPEFGGVFSWEYFNTLPTPAAWVSGLAGAMGLTLPGIEAQGSVARVDV